MQNSNNIKKQYGVKQHNGEIKALSLTTIQALSKASKPGYIHGEVYQRSLHPNGSVTTWEISES